MSLVLPRVGWWNFTPQAPDLEVTCLQGEYIDIDMRKYLRQGANPPSERIRMEFDANYLEKPADFLQLRSVEQQRGFIHNLKVIKPPEKGTLLSHIDGYGLYRYTPNAEFFGEDSFDYCLATNWQSSEKRTVKITVEKKIVLRIAVYCHTLNNHLFRYSIDHSLTSPYVFVNWYRLTPFRSKDGDVPIIIQNLVLAVGYTYQYDVNLGKVTFTDTCIFSPWYLSPAWPNPQINRRGYIEGTQDIYVQPDGPFPMIASIWTADAPIIQVNNVTGWTNLKQYSVDVRSNGDDWWKNGMVAWVS